MLAGISDVFSLSVGFNALLFLFRMDNKRAVINWTMPHFPAAELNILYLYFRLHELFPHSVQWYKIKARSLIETLLTKSSTKREKKKWYLYFRTIKYFRHLCPKASVRITTKASCFISPVLFISVAVFLYQFDGKMSEDGLSGLKRSNQSKQRPRHTSTLATDMLDSLPDKSCRSAWRTNSTLIRLLWLAFFLPW